MNALDMFKAEGKAEGIAEGKAEGIAEGKAEGIAEGIAEGKLEKNREACTNMIKLGFEDEMICNIQDVTLEFVQALRQELTEQQSDLS